MTTITHEAIPGMEPPTQRAKDIAVLQAAFGYANDNPGDMKAQGVFRTAYWEFYERYLEAEL